MNNQIIKLETQKQSLEGQLTHKKDNNSRTRLTSEQVSSSDQDDNILKIQELSKMLKLKDIKLNQANQQVELLQS